MWFAGLSPSRNCSAHIGISQGRGILPLWNHLPQPRVGQFLPAPKLARCSQRSLQMQFLSSLTMSLVTVMLGKFFSEPDSNVSSAIFPPVPCPFEHRLQQYQN